MNTVAAINPEESTAPSVPVSKASIWSGWVLSGLPIAFLLMDGLGKLARPKAVVEGTIQLGYPESILLGLGVVLLVCTMLYAIPRTAILGAILLTGYLGGAVATHARVGNPWLTHVLFPVYVAVLLWGGLFLREQRLRALVPFRR